MEKLLSKQLKIKNYYATNLTSQHSKTVSLATVATKLFLPNALPETFLINLFQDVLS